MSIKQLPCSGYGTEPLPDVPPLGKRNCDRARHIGFANEASLAWLTIWLKPTVEKICELHLNDRAHPANGGSNCHAHHRRPHLSVHQ